VSEALRLGAISFDAVKMLLLARLETAGAARSDFYPYLPATTVGTTDPRAYLGLIAGSGFVSLAGERRHDHVRRDLDGRRAAGPARQSSQGLEASHIRASMKSRHGIGAGSRRLPALSAAAVRTGAHRSRASQHRASHSAGALSADQELRYVRLRRQPSLNKALVLELMRCEWIDRRQNCLALGHPAPAKRIRPWGWISCCQKGYSVAFTTAAALVHELMEARDERRLRALQKHLSMVKLLIVDELAMCRSRRSAPNCSSRCSVSAMNAAPRWSQQPAIR